jgi:hypothetical protein
MIQVSDPSCLLYVFAVTDMSIVPVYDGRTSFPRDGNLLLPTIQDLGKNDLNRVTTVACVAVGMHIYRTKVTGRISMNLVSVVLLHNPDRTRPLTGAAAEKSKQE